MNRSLARLSLALASWLSLAGAAAAAREDVPAAPAPAEPDLFRTAADKRIAFLKGEFGEEFFTFMCDDGVMPRPYLVAVEHKKNVDMEIVEKELAQIFGSLYRLFYSEYGELLQLDPIAVPVPVLLFNSKDAYEEARGAHPRILPISSEFAAGYYTPGTGLLVQWHPDSDGRKLKQTLWNVMFHEGTHQLVDFSTKKFGGSIALGAPWFQEGVAEYLGGAKRETVPGEKPGTFDYKFSLGEFLPHRFTTVQRAIQTGSVIPLYELTHLDFGNFVARRDSQEGSSDNQRYIDVLYAQGWALVMFLNRAGDGKYKNMFNEYFVAESRGEGGGPKFSEIFMLETDEDWADFDQEFVEWVQVDLREMGKDFRKAKQQQGG